MIHILVWAIKAAIVFIKLGAFGIDLAPFLALLGEVLPDDILSEVLPGEEEVTPQ